MNAEESVDQTLERIERNLVEMKQLRWFFMRSFETMAEELAGESEATRARAAAVMIGMGIESSAMALTLEKLATKLESGDVAEARTTLSRAFKDAADAGRKGPST